MVKKITLHLPSRLGASDIVHSRMSKDDKHEFNASAYGYCGGGLVAKSCPTLVTPWTVT